MYINDEEPMVQCRVCGSMIDINNKRDQHVVKCEYCNEATVSVLPIDLRSYFLLINYISIH